MNGVLVFAFLILFFSCTKDPSTATYNPAKDYYTVVTDTALGGGYVMEIYSPDTFKAGYNKVLVGLRPISGNYLTVGTVQLKLAPLAGEEIMAGVENPVYSDGGLFEGAVMLNGTTGTASNFYLSLSYLHGSKAFDVETTVTTRAIQRKTLYTFENEGTAYWLSVVSDSVSDIGPVSVEWVLFRKDVIARTLVPANDKELTFSDKSPSLLVVNTDSRGRASFITTMGNAGTMQVSVSLTDGTYILAGPFDFTIYLKD